MRLDKYVCPVCGSSVKFDRSSKSKICTSCGAKIDESRSETVLDKKTGATDKHNLLKVIGILLVFLFGFLPDLIDDIRDDKFHDIIPKTSESTFSQDPDKEFIRMTGTYNDTHTAYREFLKIMLENGKCIVKNEDSGYSSFLYAEDDEFAIKDINSDNVDELIYKSGRRYNILGLSESSKTIELKGGYNNPEFYQTGYVISKYTEDNDNIWLYGEDLTICLTNNGGAFYLRDYTNFDSLSERIITKAEYDEILKKYTPSSKKIYVQYLDVNDKNIEQYLDDSVSG